MRSAVAEPKGSPTRVLERGDIFFLYRPLVDEDAPSSLADVQRFFIVLRPQRSDRLRLLVVGRKRLPDLRRHERNWGFVAQVTRNPATIEEALREATYATKTRGEQRQPAARPAGEGRYAVALLDGQMHLAYVLEHPAHPAEVQRAFKIAPQASFALSVKNPEKDSPPGTGLDAAQEVVYPERLQREFRGRRFEREDIRLLDAEGAEFILVGARGDPEAVYDIDIEAGRHSDILRELDMAPSRHPIAP